MHEFHSLDTSLQKLATEVLQLPRVIHPPIMLKYRLPNYEEKMFQLLGREIMRPENGLVDQVAFMDVFRKHSESSWTVFGQAPEDFDPDQIDGI
jgi:hypothetical protein